MSKLSVIVPVYNVEKYLRQCIDSLLTQTMNDIEIILVDDGSKDRSGIICDEYQKKDTRIVTIHKDNEGLAKARKSGIERASSEYICFLDSDDYYDKLFCETMYNKMISEGADIVECDYIRFSKKIFNRISLYKSSLVLTRNDFIEQILKYTVIDGNVAVVVWNKLYKRDLINKYIKDYGESPLEDYIFNMQYYQGVYKYAYINKPLVYYRQTAGSITSSVDKDVLRKLLKVQKVKENIMNNLNINNNEYLQLSYSWFYKYIKSAVINMLVKKDNLIINFDEYIYRILSNGEFQRIVNSIEWGNKEIRLLQNRKYRKYINEIKKQAVVRRCRIKLAGIKQKLKAMRG